MRDIRYERGSVPQWQIPKHPRKFNEKFKHQMVKLYDNGKPTS